MKILRKIILIPFFFISCQDDLNDSKYRNGNWVWFVGKEGTGEWLPITERMGVDSGSAIEFYSTGEIYSTSVIVDSVHVDTVKIFSKNGELLRYSLPNESNEWTYMEDGDYIDHHKTGEILTKGTIVNGKLIGKWEMYSAKGHLDYKEHTDGINDTSMYYYPSGQLKSISFHVHGVQQGTFRTYTEEGVLTEVSNWLDGELDGEQRYYYESGDLYGTQKFEMGKQTGVSKRFYSNQRLRSEINFEHGLRNGPYRKYYENGQIALIAYYYNGMGVGTWEYFYPNGAKYTEGKLSDNEFEGEWTFNSIKGTPFMYRLFKNGKLIVDSTLTEISSEEQHEHKKVIEFTN